MNVLRWVLAPPAAAICGYLAYIVGGFINNVTIGFYLGTPPQGVMKIIADVAAHTYLGAAFVYVAVRVAPSSPRYVASAAFGLLLILAGISLWSSFAIGNFYALPAIGGLLLGGTAGLVGTFASEIRPYQSNNAN